MSMVITYASLLKVSARQWNTPVNFGSALSTSDCQFSVGANNTLDSAREALTHVQHAVRGWHELAASAEIAMSRRDREFWASAFEFDQADCSH